MATRNVIAEVDMQRVKKFTPEFLLGLLEHLVLLREFELACERWWKADEPLVGEFHLSQGQEAFTVGTCAAAQPQDPICPSIRGMGIYLCRGTSMVQLMASFFERQGSISAGQWAHWHSAVPGLNILPQTGMLGSGLLSAAGVALSKKLREQPGVVIAMLGDGTTNTGNFHEGVNFAAALTLPMVIVIENNQIAVSTRISDVTRVEDLSSRAVAYGIPGVTVDGNDVLAVYEAVSGALRSARAGTGPTLVELKSYRWGGQTLKDPDTLRPVAEKEAARADCPILRLRACLSEAGLLSEAQYSNIVAGVQRRISSAEREARALPVLERDDPDQLRRMLNTYAD